MMAILERIELMLAALLKGQEEVTLLLKAAPQAAVPAGAEEWLTKCKVMDLLCITESTFYRRLAVCNWERKRNGRSWYYLKSSVI